VNELRELAVRIAAFADRTQSPTDQVLLQRAAAALEKGADAIDARTLEAEDVFVLSPEQAKIVKDLIYDVGEHGAAGMSLDYWRSPEGIALLQKVGAAVGSHAADMRKAMEEEYAARKK
jgi:hypothetical protein